MIILEGPDGGGKTTLASSISEMTAWPVIGSEGPTHSLDDFYGRLDRYALRGSQVIYDRHPIISEQVYGQAYGRQYRVPEIAKQWLQLQQPLIIYCTSPSGELGDQGNLAIDTEEYVAKLRAHHNIIKQLYESYFLNNPPTLRYVWGVSIEARIMGHKWRR